MGTDLLPGRVILRLALASPMTVRTITYTARRRMCLALYLHVFGTDLGVCPQYYVSLGRPY